MIDKARLRTVEVVSLRENECRIVKVKKKSYQSARNGIVGSKLAKEE